MNLQRILVALFGLVLVTLAFRAYGWAGAAVVTGGVVMWVLLNFTRTVTVLQRAAKTPIGYVGSAVMLNAKLKPRVTLLHVIALTRALGELRSPKDQQPEIYRWTDGADSHVTCEFESGKLVRWELVRPPTDPAANPAPNARSALSGAMDSPIQATEGGSREDAHGDSGRP